MTTSDDTISCHYINLDRAPVRRGYMDDLSASLGIKLQRVKAIDGDALDDAFCRSASPALSDTKPLTKSEIGCFLSHRAAWQNIVKSGKPWGCVFEDDIRLSDDIANYLSTSAWIPAHVQFIRLEAFPFRRVILSNEEIAIAGERHLTETKSYSLGAAGYLLAAELAAKLLEQTETIDRPLDILLTEPGATSIADLRVWQVVPAVCIQQKSMKQDTFLPAQAEPSSISYSRVRPRVHRSGWRKRVYRKFNKVRAAYINWRAARKARQMNATWTGVPFRK